MKDQRHCHLCGYILKDKYCQNKTCAEYRRDEDEEEKSDFWTLTATFQICAGDMEKDEVISSAEQMLIDMTDGSDIMSIHVAEAERDEF